MGDDLITRITNSNMEEKLKRDILDRLNWILEWNKTKVASIQQEIPPEFDEVFKKNFWDLLA